ncbi:PTS galactitol transporter subunit IIC, partial [Streptococcus agalactiae]
TELAKKVGAFPAGARAGSLITHSTLEGPMEKIFGYVIGKATTGQLSAIITLIIFATAYLGLFMWYAKQMKRRNAEYAANQK